MISSKQHEISHARTEEAIIQLAEGLNKTLGMGNSTKEALLAVLKRIERLEDKISTLENRVDWLEHRLDSV